jgi:hypothetical protein
MWSLESSVLNVMVFSLSQFLDNAIVICLLLNQSFRFAMLKCTKTRMTGEKLLVVCCGNLAKWS